MPRKATVVEKKTVKPKTTAMDRLDAKIAKLDSKAGLLKVANTDFIQYLAVALDKGAGVSVPSIYGDLEIKPRNPKELKNIVRYLGRQATKP